jgi:hypothetical protein
MAATLTMLTGGAFQDSNGSPLAFGYLTLKLSQDGNVAGVGNICSGVTITIQLDVNGNVAGLTSPIPVANQYVWANSNISPINTYYKVTGYTQEGQRAFGLNNQQVAAGATFNVGTWVPNSVISWFPNPQSLALEVNGVPASSQTVQNLEAGANITITDEGSGNIQIAATSGGASFSTAGQGFFLGAQSICGDAASIDSSGGSINTANVVYVMQLNLEAEYTVRSAAVYVVTSGGALGSINVGIYSESGAKILDSGALNMATASSQQFVQATLGSPIVIGPGTYWFAFASTPSGSSSSMLSQAIDQFFVQMVNEISFPNSSGAVTRFGTAANVLSGGALPATLGTITPAAYNATNIPAALFLV